MQDKKCCFIGHRNTVETLELREKLKQTVVCLIEEKGVTRFLFGSASKFDDLCLKMVTKLKETYPEIRRVYVRSEYVAISKFYERYLLEIYDETLMPERIENAGKASYVERNQAMIDASDFCVFYYDCVYEPPIRKQSKRSLTSYQPSSGTKLAYEYAVRKSKDGKKQIFNLCEGEKQ